MKVRALVFKLRNGETHVLVNTLHESRLRDTFVSSQQAFPESVPLFVEFDLPVEAIVEQQAEMREVPDGC